MTIFMHELKRNKNSFIVWTSVITAFILMIILIFPEMKKQMQEINDIFASLGSFTAAFGMDRLNLGKMIDYYSIEAGAIVSLGGSFYAALIAVSILSKEEKEHTADFLLTHPVSRTNILKQKLLAVLTLVVMLNVIVASLTFITIYMIESSVDWNLLILLNLSYLILQIEVAAICFGISAFLRKDGMGIGLGLAATFYFLNLVANITEKAKFLKYFTPFAYTEGADIINNGVIDMKHLALGIVITILCITVGFIKYQKKDIL